MNIKSAKFIVSNQNAKDCPKSDLPEYAFIGRSNVGKSSLINYFSNKHSALVSNKLHSTRISTSHIIDYNNVHIEFIDTPGASIDDNNLLSKAMKSNASKYMTNADIIILLTQPQEKYDYEIKIKNQIIECNKKYMEPL